jgi:hypothetical protein
MEGCWYVSTKTDTAHACTRERGDLCGGGGVGFDNRPRRDGEIVWHCVNCIKSTVARDLCVYCLQPHSNNLDDRPSMCGGCKGIVHDSCAARHAAGDLPCVNKAYVKRKAQAEGSWGTQLWLPLWSTPEPPP